MIKKIYTIICALGLMAALPIFGMNKTPDNPCTQCHYNEAKIGGIGHTTNITALLSLQLPFKSARHNLCDACENRVENINLSPLQSLGCKHCYLQKNHTYIGCSTIRFWSEITLITGVICYSAYKAYTWWKGEEKQEKDTDDKQGDQEKKTEPAKHAKKDN